MAAAAMWVGQKWGGYVLAGTVSLLVGPSSPQPTADRRCPAVQVGLRFGVF
jgi:hypothetical protein